MEGLSSAEFGIMVLAGLKILDVLTGLSSSKKDDFLVSILTRVAKAIFK